MQKLTDPDYVVGGAEGGEGGLAGWGGTTPPATLPGRAWSLPGSSLAAIFPGELRGRANREAAAAPAQPDSAPAPPMRLSDMLKRKRVSSR